MVFAYGEIINETNSITCIIEHPNKPDIWRTTLWYKRTRGWASLLGPVLVP